MADFFDQAKAIWKALDEMSEKDPEEYKRFISEQLQDGKNSNMLQGPRSQSADKKAQKEKQGQPLEEVMEKLCLHSAPSPDGIKKSGVNQAKTNDIKVKTVKPGTANVKGDKEANLLDDEICEKSMLSNIVKKVSSTQEQDDGDSDVVINELRIPSAESVPASRARNRAIPLIEEI